MKCTCENCGRTQLDMETVTLHCHVATLCVTCAHVLQQDPQRLKHLVLSKSESESNTEMKKQHQLVNHLITIGAVGLVAILGVGIVEQLPAFATTTVDYLSFANLKKY